MEYDVEVSYSDHCYTKSQAGRTERVFDEERYNLSLTLPLIIESLMQMPCSFAGRSGNFFTISHENYEYEVYFKVFKPKGCKDLKLEVKSAYVRNLADYGTLRPKWKPVKFRTILYNVSHNKELHP